MMRVSRSGCHAALGSLLVIGACSEGLTRPAARTADDGVSPKTEQPTGVSGQRLFSGRAADSVLSAMATQWSMQGNPRLTDILHRLDLDGKRTRDSAARAALTPSYLLVDGGGGSTPSSQVVLSLATVPPQILSHGVQVAAGATQGTVIGSATYQGTSVDITLTYGSTNNRDGSTPNPSKSATQHIGGYALTQCLSSTTYVPSPSCNLINTQKATAVLDLPLPCEQTVSGSGSYVANLSLLASMSAGIISIPLDVNFSSSIANDITSSATSATCTPPSAHLDMHGPTMRTGDGGSITEETTSSQVAVSLSDQSQQGSAPITKWEWTANGSPIGNTYAFNWLASPGSWTVTLKVTDAAGLSSQASASLTVSNPNDNNGDWGSGTGTGGGTNDGPTYPEPSPTPDTPDLPPITGGAFVCQTTAQWVGRWDDGGSYYQEVTDCYPVNQ